MPPRKRVRKKAKPLVSLKATKKKTSKLSKNTKAAVIARRVATKQRGKRLKAEGNVGQAEVLSIGSKCDIYDSPNTAKIQDLYDKDDSENETTGTPFRNKNKVGNEEHFTNTTINDCTTENTHTRKSSDCNKTDKDEDDMFSVPGHEKVEDFLGFPSADNSTEDIPIQHKNNLQIQSEDNGKHSTHVTVNASQHTPSQKSQKIEKLVDEVDHSFSLIPEENVSESQIQHSQRLLGQSYDKDKCIIPTASKNNFIPTNELETNFTHSSEIGVEKGSVSKIRKLNRNSLQSRKISLGDEESKTLPLDDKLAYTCKSSPVKTKVALSDRFKPDIVLESKKSAVMSSERQISQNTFTNSPKLATSQKTSKFPGISFVISLRKSESEPAVYDCVACHQTSQKFTQNGIRNHGASKSHLLKVMELISPKDYQVFSQRQNADVNEINKALQDLLGDLDKDGIAIAFPSTYLIVRGKISERIFVMKKKKTIKTFISFDEKIVKADEVQTKNISRSITDKGKSSQLAVKSNPTTDKIGTKKFSIYRPEKNTSERTKKIPIIDLDKDTSETAAVKSAETKKIIKNKTPISFPEMIRNAKSPLKPGEATNKIQTKKILISPSKDTDKLANKIKTKKVPISYLNKTNSKIPAMSDETANKIKTKKIPISYPGKNISAQPSAKLDETASKIKTKKIPISFPEKDTSTKPAVKSEPGLGDSDDDLKDIEEKEENFEPSLERNKIFQLYKKELMELVELQKGRSPSKVIIVTDERDVFYDDEIITDDDNHLCKIFVKKNLTLSSTFSFLKRKKEFGTGVLFIILCGANDVNREIIHESCRSVNCHSPCAMLEETCTKADLIGRALNLHLAILNSTEHDMVLFAELFIISPNKFNRLAVEMRSCYELHPADFFPEMKLSKSTFMYYSSFVKIHARTLGFSCLDIEKLFTSWRRGSFKALIDGYHFTDDAAFWRRQVVTKKCIKYINNLDQRNYELKEGPSSRASTEWSRFTPVQYSMESSYGELHSSQAKYINNEDYLVECSEYLDSRSKYDKIVVLGNSQYTYFLQQIKGPKVHVMTDDILMEDLKNYIEEKLKLSPSRTLWILITGISFLFDTVDNEACTIKNCKRILYSVMPAGEVCTLYKAKKTFTLLSDCLKNLISDINRILSSDSEFMIFPPIPPSMISESLKDHSNLHYLQSANPRSYIVLASNCVYFNNLFKLLSAIFAKFTASSLRQLGISSAHLLKYLKQKSCQIDVVEQEIGSTSSPCSPKYFREWCSMFRKTADSALHVMNDGERLVGAAECFKLESGVKDTATYPSRIVLYDDDNGEDDPLDINVQPWLARKESLIPSVGLSNQSSGSTSKVPSDTSKVFSIIKKEKISPSQFSTKAKQKSQAFSDLATFCRPLSFAVHSKASASAASDSQHVLHMLDDDYLHDDAASDQIERDLIDDDFIDVEEHDNGNTDESAFHGEGLGSTTLYENRSEASQEISAVSESIMQYIADIRKLSSENKITDEDGSKTSNNVTSRDQLQKESQLNLPAEGSSDIKLTDLIDNDDDNRNRENALADKRSKMISSPLFGTPSSRTVETIEKDKIESTYRIHELMNDEWSKIESVNRSSISNLNEPVSYTVNQGKSENLSSSELYFNNLDCKSHKDNKFLSSYQTNEVSLKISNMIKPADSAISRSILIDKHIDEVKKLENKENNESKGNEKYCLESKEKGDLESKVEHSPMLSNKLKGKLKDRHGKNLTEFGNKVFDRAVIIGNQYALDYFSEKFNKKYILWNLEFPINWVEMETKICTLKAKLSYLFIIVGDITLIGHENIFIECLNEKSKCNQQATFFSYISTLLGKQRLSAIELLMNKLRDIPLIEKRVIGLPLLPRKCVQINLCAINHELIHTALSNAYKPCILDGSINVWYKEARDLRVNWAHFVGSILGKDPLSRLIIRSLNDSGSALCLTHNTSLGYPFIVRNFWTENVISILSQFCLENDASDSEVDIPCKKSDRKESRVFENLPKQNVPRHIIKEYETPMKTQEVDTLIGEEEPKIIIENASIQEEFILKEYIEDEENKLEVDAYILSDELEREILEAEELEREILEAEDELEDDEMMQVQEDLELNEEDLRMSVQEDIVNKKVLTHDSDPDSIEGSDEFLREIEMAVDAELELQSDNESESFIVNDCPNAEQQQIPQKARLDKKSIELDNNLLFSEAKELLDNSQTCSSSNNWVSKGKKSLDFEKKNLTLRVEETSGKSLPIDAVFHSEKIITDAFSLQSSKETKETVYEKSVNSVAQGSPGLKISGSAPSIVESFFSTEENRSPRVKFNEGSYVNDETHRLQAGSVLVADNINDYLSNNVNILPPDEKQIYTEGEILHELSHISNIGIQTGRVAGMPNVASLSATKYKTPMVKEAISAEPDSRGMRYKDTNIPENDPEPGNKSDPEILIDEITASNACTSREVNVSQDEDGSERVQEDQAIENNMFLVDYSSDSDDASFEDDIAHALAEAEAEILLAAEEGIEDEVNDGGDDRNYELVSASYENKKPENDKNKSTSVCKIIQSNTSHAFIDAVPYTAFADVSNDNLLEENNIVVDDDRVTVQLKDKIEIITTSDVKDFPREKVPKTNAEQAEDYLVPRLAGVSNCSTSNIAIESEKRNITSNTDIGLENRKAERNATERILSESKLSPICITRTEALTNKEEEHLNKASTEVKSMIKNSSLQENSLMIVSLKDSTESEADGEITVNLKEVPSTSECEKEENEGQQIIKTKSVRASAKSASCKRLYEVGKEIFFEDDADDDDDLAQAFTTSKAKNKILLENSGPPSDALSSKRDKEREIFSNDDDELAQAFTVEFDKENENEMEVQKVVQLLDIASDKVGSTEVLLGKRFSQKVKEISDDDDDDDNEFSTLEFEIREHEDSIEANMTEQQIESATAKIDSTKVILGKRVSEEGKIIFSEENNEFAEAFATSELTNENEIVVKTTRELTDTILAPMDSDVGGELEERKEDFSDNEDDLLAESFPTSEFEKEHLTEDKKSGQLTDTTAAKMDSAETVSLKELYEEGREISPSNDEDDNDELAEAFTTSISEKEENGDQAEVKKTEQLPDNINIIYSTKVIGGRLCEGGKEVFSDHGNELTKASITSDEIEKNEDGTKVKRIGRLTNTNIDSTEVTLRKRLLAERKEIFSDDGNDELVNALTTSVENQTVLKTPIKDAFLTKTDAIEEEENENISKVDDELAETFTTSEFKKENEDQTADKERGQPTITLSAKIDSTKDTLGKGLSAEGKEMFHDEEGDVLKDDLAISEFENQTVVETIREQTDSILTKIDSLVEEKSEERKEDFLDDEHSELTEAVATSEIEKEENEDKADVNSGQLTCTTSTKTDSFEFVLHKELFSKEKVISIGNELTESEKTDNEVAQPLSTDKENQLLHNITSVRQNISDLVLNQNVLGEKLHDDDNDDDELADHAFLNVESDNENIEDQSLNDWNNKKLQSGMLVEKATLHQEDICKGVIEKKSRETERVDHGKVAASTAHSESEKEEGDKGESFKRNDCSLRKLLPIEVAVLEKHLKKGSSEDKDICSYDNHDGLSDAFADIETEVEDVGDLVKNGKGDVKLANKIASEQDPLSKNYPILKASLPNEELEVGEDAKDLTDGEDDDELADAFADIEAEEKLEKEAVYKDNMKEAVYEDNINKDGSMAANEAIVSTENEDGSNTSIKIHARFDELGGQGKSDEYISGKDKDSLTCADDHVTTAMNNFAKEVSSLDLIRTSSSLLTESRQEATYTLGKHLSSESSGGKEIISEMEMVVDPQVKIVRESTPAMVEAEICTLDNITDHKKMDTAEDDLLNEGKISDDSDDSIEDNLSLILNEIDHDLFDDPEEDNENNSAETGGVAAVSESNNQSSDKFVEEQTDSIITDELSLMDTGYRRSSQKQITNESLKNVTVFSSSPANTVDLKKQKNRASEVNVKDGECETLDTAGKKHIQSDPHKDQAAQHNNKAVQNNLLENINVSSFHNKGVINENSSSSILQKDIKSADIFNHSQEVLRVGAEVGTSVNQNSNKNLTSEASNSGSIIAPSQPNSNMSESIVETSVTPTAGSDNPSYNSTPLVPVPVEQQTYLEGGNTPETSKELLSSSVKDDDEIEILPKEEKIVPLVDLSDFEEETSNITGAHIAQMVKVKTEKLTDDERKDELRAFKACFDHVYLIGEHNPISKETKRILNYTFIHHSLSNLDMNNVDSLIELMEPIIPKSVCVLLFNFTVITKAWTTAKIILPKYLKDKIIIHELKITPEISVTVGKNFINSRVTALIKVIEKISAKVQVVTVPLEPARLYAQYNFTINDYHKLTANSYFVYGPSYKWSAYRSHLVLEWIRMLDTNNKELNHSCLKNFFQTSENIFPMKEEDLKGLNIVEIRQTWKQNINDMVLMLCVKQIQSIVGSGLLEQSDVDDITLESSTTTTSDPRDKGSKRCRVVITEMSSLIPDGFFIDLSKVVDLEAVILFEKGKVDVLFKSHQNGPLFSKFLNGFHLGDSVLKARLTCEEIHREFLEDEKIEMKTKLRAALGKWERTVMELLRNELIQGLNFTCYKAVKCNEEKCDPMHCIFYHTEGDRRRNPLTFPYGNKKCQYGAFCKQKAKCQFAHNMFEQMFHPLNLHSFICQEFNREICFKKHSLCSSAHKDSPDSFFTHFWTDLIVYNHSFTFTYLAGAIRKFTLANPLFRNCRIFMIGASNRFLEIVRNAVAPICQMHTLPHAFIGEREMFFECEPLLYGKPSAFNTFFTRISLLPFTVIIVGQVNEIMADKEEKKALVEFFSRCKFRGTPPFIQKLFVADAFEPKLIEKLERALGIKIKISRNPQPTVTFKHHIPFEPMKKIPVFTQFIGNPIQFIPLQPPTPVQKESSSWFRREDFSDASDSGDVRDSDFDLSSEDESSSSRRTKNDKEIRFENVSKDTDRKRRRSAEVSESPSLSSSKRQKGATTSDDDNSLSEEEDTRDYASRNIRGSSAVAVGRVKQDSRIGVLSRSQKTRDAVLARLSFPSKKNDSRSPKSIRLHSRSPTFYRDRARSPRSKRSRSRSPTSDRSRLRSPRSNRNRSRSPVIRKAESKRKRLTRRSSVSKSSSPEVLTGKTNLVPYRNSNSVSPERLPPKSQISKVQVISSPSTVASFSDDKTATSESPTKKASKKAVSVMDIARLSALLERSSRYCDKQLLRKELGEELLKEFEKQELLVCSKLEEEFEVFKTMPDMYDKYEECYENFMETYLLKYPNKDEKHKDRLWTEFWKSKFEYVKERELKKRVLDLIKEYRKKVVHVASFSKEATASSSVQVPASHPLSLRSVTPVSSPSSYHPPPVPSSFAPPISLSKTSVAISSSQTALFPAAASIKPFPHSLQVTKPKFTGAAASLVVGSLNSRKAESLISSTKPASLAANTGKDSMATKKPGQLQSSKSTKQSFPSCSLFALLETKKSLKITKGSTETSPKEPTSSYTKATPRRESYSRTSSSNSTPKIKSLIKEVARERKTSISRSSCSKSLHKSMKSQSSTSSNQSHHWIKEERSSSTSNVRSFSTTEQKRRSTKDESHERKTSTKDGSHERKTSCSKSSSKLKKHRRSPDSPRKRSSSRQTSSEKESKSVKENKKSKKEAENIKELPFDIDKALNLLESMVPDLGILGHSIASIVWKAKNLGTNTKNALKVFTDSESIELIEMALKKIKSKYGAEGKSDFVNNVEKTIKHLMDYAQSAQTIEREAHQSEKQKSSLNINAIAMATNGKDTASVLKMIQSASAYEGLTFSSEEINQIFLEVCTIHLQIAVKKDL